MNKALSLTASAEDMGYEELLSGLENREEYKKVIDEFKREKVLMRYHRLIESAKKFIQEMGYGSNVVCNGGVLMLAVLDYFADILRLKEFHDIKLVNEVKILAYETVSLLRRKPLQIKNGENGEYAFCNEQFVFTQIFLWFDKDEDEGKNKGSLCTFLNDDMKFFHTSVLYHLKYRVLDPQALELILLSFVAGRHYQRLRPETSLESWSLGAGKQESV